MGSLFIWFIRIRRLPDDQQCQRLATYSGGTQAYPSGSYCKTIQSGQAFFVHATQLVPGVPQTSSVTFTESAKSTGSASVNFARQMGTAPDNHAYLRVSLFTGSDPTSVMADGNVVVFDKGYSDSIDGNDAIKIINSGENCV